MSTRHPAIAGTVRRSSTPAWICFGARYARLDWVTADDNHDAQRFYDRHGGRRGPWVSYSATVTDR